MERTLHWHLVHSRCGAAAASTSFLNARIAPRRNPSRTSCDHCPLRIPPAPGKQDRPCGSGVCLFWTLRVGGVIQPVVVGDCLLREHIMFLRFTHAVSGLHAFVRPNGLSLYGRTTVYQSGRELVDTCAVSVMQLCATVTPKVPA